MDKDSNVGIVGMGYVGTSIASVLYEKGYQVYGIDIDEEKISKMSKGNCPIDEDRITELFETGILEGEITPSNDVSLLTDASTIIVTVGTPLDGADPDLSAVEAVSNQVGSILEQGQRIIYRSTIPPGTTENIIQPILEDESGLVAGDDFYLAFCPERMAEGTAYEDLTSIPVILGGVDSDSADEIENFLIESGMETYRVSSPTTAEFAKLVDNWWIDLNIALANEIALMSEEVGVDALEVIGAANSLPKGDSMVNILYPGSGVGGSCLIKDPRFVSRKAEDLGLDIETPKVSRWVNEKMPGHVVELTEDALGSVDNKKVAVLGYSFKKGTDDTRNTPSKIVVEELLEKGAIVTVSDPYVEEKDIEDEVGLEKTSLKHGLKNADAVVVMTDHRQYSELELAELREEVGRDFALIDGRHVFDPEKMESRGIVYRGVGRGNY